MDGYGLRALLPGQRERRSPSRRSPSAVSLSVLEQLRRPLLDSAARKRSRTSQAGCRVRRSRPRVISLGPSLPDRQPRPTWISCTGRTDPRVDGTAWSERSPFGRAWGPASLLAAPCEVLGSLFSSVRREGSPVLRGPRRKRSRGGNQSLRINSRENGALAFLSKRLKEVLL